LMAVVYEEPKSTAVVSEPDEDWIV
jgi:hypothetical protein